MSVAPCSASVIVLVRGATTLRRFHCGVHFCIISSFQSCSCRRDFTSVAWAMAVLKHRPGIKWLESYCDEAGRRLAHLDPQPLTDLLWALGAFGHVPDPTWISQLERVLNVRGRLLSKQQAAVVLWALAQFKARISCGWVTGI